MNDEPSIFDPAIWPDVWAELARFMQELEDETNKQEQEP